METNKEELVSIIMPSYNCGEFVEDTIRSVQAQTYQNWEIIFLDDCSTDDTMSIVKKLREEDSRIRLFQNKINSGAAVSRNKALREAKGRWIAFLDSDDLWEPTKLEKQVRFMEKNGYKFNHLWYEKEGFPAIEVGFEDGTYNVVDVLPPLKMAGFLDYLRNRFTVR